MRERKRTGSHIVVCGGLHIINEINMVLKRRQKHYVRVCLQKIVRRFSKYKCEIALDLK